MEPDMIPPEDSADQEKKEKAKKSSRLNGIILACVFLLSIVLPRPYKAFTPLLFLIPLIYEIANKLRQSGETPENPQYSSSHIPNAPDHASPTEPYYYKPKDPKDPRRYKPIG